ncbi:MAG: ATP-binding cassette domain-containing protein [Myxococcota bacterium]
MTQGIEVTQLERHYRLHGGSGGLWGRLRALASRDGETWVRAVDGVSFRIEPGEFVGYVGPNGAGKSSTLKMLTGILRPTGGEVRVWGLVPHRQRTVLASRIGVVFGQRTQLWWDLSPAEGFELLRHIYRVDVATHRRRLADLRDRLELGDFVRSPVRKLSLGQKMRCELAAALLHGPEVLFLDEPTIGLDVVVKAQLHAFLRQLNREHGVTVLLTSHDLDDIEQLCRRVMVLDHGHLLHDGDLPSLYRQHGHLRRLTVQLADPDAPLDLPEGAVIDARDAATITIVFDADRVAAPDLVRSLLDAHEVRDLSVQEARIEEVIKRIYSTDHHPLQRP